VVRRSNRSPAAYAIVAKGFGAVAGGWRLFVSQTVEQNLRLGAAVISDRSRIASLFDRAYALFPGLPSDVISLPARSRAANARCSRSHAR